MSKSNRFCFTINNYDEVHFELFGTDLSNKLKYWIGGKEVGENGTPHLQCYAEFDHGQRLRCTAAKARLVEIGFPNSLHIEIAKGNAAQNIAYCSKDNNFKEGGQRPVGRGKRTDLDDVCDLIANGSNLHDIALSHPTAVVKFSNGIQRLMSLRLPKRFFKTQVIWLYGPTGTGKSRYAWDAAPEAYMKSSSHKWWDGYTGQDVVIVDDYRPSTHLPFNFVLNLFDRYPLSVEFKGGMIEFCSKTIYVTSPFSPEQTCQQLEWIGEEMRDQFLRRIDQVKHFSAENPWIPPQN